MQGKHLSCLVQEVRPEPSVHTINTPLLVMKDIRVILKTLYSDSKREAIFVFSVCWPSGGRIGNRDRHWKARRDLSVDRD